MSGELDATAADTAGTGSQTSALVAGGSLGKYKLVRVLGTGGMGVVWAAHDPDLDRTVALKVLRYADAGVQLRQRLLREARAMAKLKHPNVLTVYEVGTVGERDYIAMELVEGATLDHWLTAAPPAEEIRSAILAAGRGLAAAHAAGVVHRDFKPHNVLRSRDGRVLVTDFGLARGLLGDDDSAAVAESPRRTTPSVTPALDATLEAPSNAPSSTSGASGHTPTASASKTPSARTSDSVLDAPLTQTGALIGTPAYMAPEQYRGAPPDPRTDQFAFCVTAWQALTGERPFKGQTLDEMRTAVGGGVAHLTARLPRTVRAILARGLEPDPAARWPDLESLLDALERAWRKPTSRRQLVLAIGISIFTLSLITGLLERRGRSAEAHACDAPEQAFAEAWSPSVRAELARTSPGDSFERVAGAFDQFRERWVDRYQKACRTKSSKQFAARARCLENLRDQTSALTLMLRSAPPQVYEAFDAHSMLPHLGACDRAQPDAPPLVPRDQPRRTRVLELLARTIALRGMHGEQLDTAADTLEREIEATGWKPALAGLYVTAGMTYLRTGNVGKARELYRRALPVVKEQADRRMMAVILLGQLEASMIELAEPGARVPPRIDDPKAPPVLHRELANAFIAARSATQDDPVLLGSVAVLGATAHGHLAQFNRYRAAYTDAIAFAQEARKQYESLGDIHRAARSSAIEALIYLERADDRALDDALFAARRAADALELARLPPLPVIDDILAAVAFARPDYTEVHRRRDKRPLQPATTQQTVRGRVSPAGRATVIAWRAELAGDPRRAFIDPSSTELDVVTTEPDGTFTVRAAPGWAIIAEAGDRRSLPQLVTARSPTLELRPTSTLSATAGGKNLLGVRAFARYRLADDVAWTLQVPLMKDGTFDLRGLPAGGAPTYGLTGQAGDAIRHVTTTGGKNLAWPNGQGLDVIVRSTSPSTAATIWVFRGSVQLPASPTRRDVEARALVAADIATASASRIGAQNTDAGREHYRAGDLHAVITGNATGEVTVCAALAAEPDAPAACKSVSVEPSVVLDYPDGNLATGVTPIVLEP